jgi:hypothetical protein
MGQIEVSSGFVCIDYAKDKMGRFDLIGCFLGNIEAFKVPSQSPYCVVISVIGIGSGDHSYTVKAIDPGGAQRPGDFTATNRFTIIEPDLPYTIILRNFMIGWTRTGLLRVTVAIDGGAPIDAIRLGILQSGKGTRLN